MRTRSVNHKQSVWNIIWLTQEEKVSFALPFFFSLLRTKSQTQWHWTIISHWHQMQGWNTVFTKIDTIVQINLKKEGKWGTREATSPDTFAISESVIGEGDLSRICVRREAWNKGQRKFTSANSLIDSPSVLHSSYNFSKVPAVKKRCQHIVDPYWHRETLCFPKTHCVPISTLSNGIFDHLKSVLQWLTSIQRKCQNKLRSRRLRFARKV